MDDIAGEMYFKKLIINISATKKYWLKKVIEVMHKEVHQSINAIEQTKPQRYIQDLELKMFKEMFNAGDTPPM